MMERLPYEQGLALVSQRHRMAKQADAAAIMQAVKNFAAKVTEQASRPGVREALIGAGAGAGVGLLSSAFQPKRRRNYLSRMLSGAALGGMAGYGYHALQSGAGKGGVQAEPKLPGASKAVAQQEADRATVAGNRAFIGADGKPTPTVTENRDKTVTPLLDSVKNYGQALGDSLGGAASGLQEGAARAGIDAPHQPGPDGSAAAAVNTFPKAVAGGATGAVDGFQANAAQRNEAGGAVVNAVKNIAENPAASAHAVLGDRNADLMTGTYDRITGQPDASGMAVVEDAYDSLKSPYVQAGTGAGAAYGALRNPVSRNSIVDTLQTDDGVFAGPTKNQQHKSIDEIVDRLQGAKQQHPITGHNPHKALTRGAPEILDTGELRTTKRTLAHPFNKQRTILPAAGPVKPVSATRLQGAMRKAKGVAKGKRGKLATLGRMLVGSGAGFVAGNALDPSLANDTTSRQQTQAATARQQTPAENISEQAGLSN